MSEIAAGTLFAAGLFIGWDGGFGSTGLAAVLAVTIYVIVDLEYPRLGFFQIADFDQLLVEVRASMR
jgi:hypothetical protein